VKNRTVGLVVRNTVHVSHFVTQKVMKRQLGHMEVRKINKQTFNLENVKQKRKDPNNGREQIT